MNPVLQCIDALGKMTKILADEALVQALGKLPSHTLGDEWGCFPVLSSDSDHWPLELLKHLDL